MLDASRRRSIGRAINNSMQILHSSHIFTWCMQRGNGLSSMPHRSTPLSKTIDIFPLEHFTSPVISASNCDIFSSAKKQRLRRKFLLNHPDGRRGRSEVDLIMHEVPDLPREIIPTLDREFPNPEQAIIVMIKF